MKPDKKKIIKGSKKALRNKFDKRVFDVSQKLFAKIPELKPDSGYSAVHISKYQFKNLTDEEFSYLFYAPGYTIHISKSTEKYIEKRRRELRLMLPTELPEISPQEETQKK